MALRKNLALMGVSAACRLVAGLFTFSVLARLLGPATFGEFMLWLAVSVLLSLLPNYGLTPYVLREIGANPESAEKLMNEGFTGKLLLAAALFFCATLTVFGFEPALGYVFLCLLAGSVADTFTEFINAGFRARDKFASETRIVMISSLIHAAIVTGAVTSHPTIETAALAYTVSRVIILTITIFAVMRIFAPLRLVSIHLAVQRLRNAITYAVDFAFQSLFGQIDSVVLNYFLGPVAVGLHQAGLRIFLGGAQVAPILANVFLPRASANTQSKARFSEESRKIQIVFLGFGAIFGVTLAVLGEPLVLLIFGSGYRELIPLMPFFGLLFFMRFAAAAWGIVLTARGQQVFRTWASVLHWLVIAAAAWILVPVYGNRGWLIALCVGNLLLGLAYAMRGRNLVEKHWEMLGLTALGSFIFLPFVRFN